MTSSWFNPKTEKRTSPIQGRGLFARNAIAAGEIVAVKGGAIMDLDALALIRDEVSPAEIQIEDGLYIVSRSAAEVESNILCLNHSCNPNVGVRGQITFVAMRDIPVGEELTRLLSDSFTFAGSRDFARMKEALSLSLRATIPKCG